MEKLSSLNHALLPKSVYKILAINNITTIFEFLQQDTEKLSTLTKLNLPQILDIRDYIFKEYAAPVLDGPSLLYMSENRKKYINTGIDSLNAVLGGGIPVGYITEIYGLAASGKTQLCFQLAINCSRQSENTVLYIDTKGDFTAIRIQQILNSLGYTHQEMALCLYRIKIVHIWSMDEILEFFKKLKNKTIFIENLILIIIDTLPCLLLQHFGDDNKIGLTYLNMLVNHCRFVCRNYEVGIICINIQTRWVEQDIIDFEDEQDQVKEISYVEKQTRCLGKYWRYIPGLVLLMEKMNVTDHMNSYKQSFPVKISVIRSNILKVGEQCILNVDSSGVR